MRLLASTDFALRVLMLLSAHPPGRPVTVETLARQLGGLSRHHLHKIVQDLTAAGVTRTLRGATGGVELAVKPSALRLGTLIRLLEEGQPLVECFRPEGCTCTLVAQCRLRTMLHVAREAFYRELESHTLAECVSPSGLPGDGVGSPHEVRPAGPTPGTEDEGEGGTQMRKAEQSGAPVAWPTSRRQPKTKPNRG